MVIEGEIHILRVGEGGRVTCRVVKVVARTHLRIVNLQ